MTTAEMYVTNPKETADKKAAAAREAARTRAGIYWQANLWLDISNAVDWANADPVSKPGEIVFNTLDNGHVWTYTALGQEPPPER